nr:hypothetical protein [Tanacetum cinerariifolium]
MEDLKTKYLDEMKRLSNSEYRNEIKIAELIENFNGISIEIRKKEKLLQLEQWAYLSTHPSKHLNSFCYDDDEDYIIAVTPSFPIEEPNNSLSMGDDHLDTIPATKSDEVIKSSVENLIQIPSESEGIPEHMCDLSFHYNSPPLDFSKDQFEDFSESNDEFSLTGGIDYDILLTIGDDILRENLFNVNHLFAKIETLNDNPIPLFDPIISGTPPTLTPFGESDFFLEEDNAFLVVEDEPTSSQFPQSNHSDEEIIPMKMDQHYYNAESDLMESLRIDETDCDFKEDIRLIERLLYDNSSPRPPEEFVSANSDAEIKFFSPSPILVKDSDSLLEEIDLSCTLDYPMSSGIEDDDYDSERDILILKDLPSNDTLLIPEIDSFHFDILSFSHPPAKPPDGKSASTPIDAEKPLLKNSDGEDVDVHIYRYKIIRADDTHQLYISFITLLKNFDREDLEDLWRIMKDRFSTSKPTNFFDDYLLSTLKTMFKKTDGQDAIWRNQQSVYGQPLVKSWKLLTSCGVHIISLTTTSFILLVERRYPLLRFTLEQLVNMARHKVEEESEMSLELLRFTR